MPDRPSYDLPLFPLNLVLYPFTRIQLHIFEHRYRQMVRYCLDNDEPFGIVLIRSGDEVGGIADPYLVGTAVRILDVYHHSDGRMDITVQGTDRFRIREMDESRPYLWGKVERVEDVMDYSETVEVAETADTAKSLINQLLNSNLDLRDFNVSVIFPDSPEELSFRIASMLELPPLKMQTLLETTNTLHRFEELLAILEQHVERGRENIRRVHSEDLKEWVSPN